MNGVLNMAGTNSITYTDASPTGAELYAPLGQAIDAVASGIYLPPTHIWVHPRRWYWLASQTDSNGRRYVTPYAGNGFNSLAVQGRVAAEGPVGSVLGVDVYLDANIPTNLGAGTNEDRIIVARMSELRLWESYLRARALMEVLSGTLQVRLQVYEYLAFIGTRQPKSVSIISGTGLVAPSGFN